MRALGRDALRVVQQLRELRCPTCGKLVCQMVERAGVRMVVEARDPATHCNCHKHSTKVTP